PPRAWTGWRAPGGSGPPRPPPHRAPRARWRARAGPGGAPGAPPLGDVHLRAPWFPSDAPQRATAHCGLYDVALVGDQLYGWQDAAVVAGSRSSGPATG
ncbi:hypothetical protein ACFV6F_32905, partial [Kitasatospora phosalacinea]